MFLTLLRLLFSPLVLPILLVYLLPYNLLWINFTLGFIFILLGMTDFFDGYLARKYNQETVLGRVLDPLADKFLTYCALIGLLAVNKIYFYWVVILIGRELLVMGMRHVAVEHGFSIPVSSMSKIKTAFQILTITIIIINPYQQLGMKAFYWNGLESAVLMVTILLSLMTAQHFYDDFMRQLKDKKESPVVVEIDNDYAH